MSLFRRRSAAEKDPDSNAEKVVASDSPLARLVIEEAGAIEPGLLARAMAQSLVHVPMPDAPPESRPRVQHGDDDGAGPPMYVVEDDDGRHALVYTTAERLVMAWGGITAATVPLASLLVRWPADIDLVIDAGLPEARELPVEMVDLARREVLEP
jgi:hypothetical protein